MKSVILLLVCLNLKAFALPVEDEWSSIFQQVNWERHYTNEQISVINYKTSAKIGQSITSFVWQLVGIKTEAKNSDAECADEIKNEVESIFGDVHQLNLCRNYPEVNALRATQMNKLDQQLTVLASAQVTCREEPNYKECYDKVATLVRAELQVIRNETQTEVKEIESVSNECIKRTNEELLAEVKDVSQNWIKCK